jgi:hypothetical protein
VNLPCLLVLLVSLAASAVAAEEVAVELPPTLTVHGQELVLNGSGVRTYLRIPMYAGGLYLTSPSSDADAIIAADEPMVVRMHIIYGRLTGKQMVRAIDRGFARATGGDTEPFVDELAMLLSSLEIVTTGDVVDIYHQPGQGLGVLLNGEFKGEVDNLDFKRAVFAIWLGPDPVQAKLKRAMLGS